MFKWTDDKYAPVKKTKYSAGFDIKARGDHIIEPHKTVIIPTGVWIDTESEIVRLFSDVLFVAVHIRSSMAVKGLMLANGVGVIDLDYPDEIGVIVHNTTDKDFVIKDGERIAQLVIMVHNGSSETLINAKYEYRERNGGFGSTGKV